MMNGVFLAILFKENMFFTPADFGVLRIKVKMTNAALKVNVIRSNKGMKLKGLKCPSCFFFNLFCFTF